MEHLAHDLWVARPQPEAAVQAFLGAQSDTQGRVPRQKPDLAEAMARAKDPGPGDESVPLSVLALTDELLEADEETWGILIAQAARAFRAAEAYLTDRLGPGRSVELDEKTWVPAGLPGPVLDTLFCTTSLVAAWVMEEAAWCVLEVHQESGDCPIAIVLYRVEG